MKSIIIIFLVVLFNSIDALSIIYRHDVDSTEYIKLGESPNFNFVGRVFKVKDANGVYPNLVTILHEGKNFISQGTCQLISENWVISAAHLFEIAETKEVEYDYNGQKVQSIEMLGISPDKKENYTLQFGNEFYEVDTIIYHPEYFDTWMSGNFLMYDVALIKLKKSIENIAPVKIYKEKEEVGLKGFSVGYGVNGDAYISTPNQSRKLAGENTIDTLWSSRDGVESFLVCDFDMLNNNDCNKTGSNKPLNLECAITGGDSGSGFICNLNGSYYLVGISPAGGVNFDQFEKTGYYCRDFWYVRTSIIQDWIKKTTGIIN